MGKEFRERARTVWAIIGHVIIAVAALLLLGWLINLSMSVLFMLVFAIILAGLLDPLVFYLCKFMQRWMAIFVVYLGIAGVLTILGLLIVPALIHQGKGFALQIPFLKDELQHGVQGWIDWYQVQLKTSPNIQNFVNAGLEALNTASRGAVEALVAAALSAISWIPRCFLILVMSIYILLDKDQYVRWFHSVLPASDRDRLQGVLTDVMGVLAAYFRGLLVMVLFVSVTVSLLLWFSGIKYWLFIGVVAGLLEVIPYFGAFTGAVPAVILGFQHSTALGVGLIFAFIVINQIEGHIVVPLAMGHSMHLRPLAVLLALLIGEAVAKVPGMIIAVPIIGILRVLWVHGRQYWRHSAQPQPSTVIWTDINESPTEPGPAAPSAPPARAPQEVAL